MTSFDSYRIDLFPDMYAAVKRLHTTSASRNRGHGLDHDVTVAMLTQTLIEPGRMAEKAWIVGMLHSVDRLVGHEEAAQVTGMLLRALPAGYFSDDEIAEMHAAAMRHGEKNLPGQSLLQQVLMDADRLANLMLLALVRIGQFNPDIPVVEFEYIDRENPLSTYQSPRNTLDAIRHCLEWKSWFRLPEAQRRGALLCEVLERYLSLIESPYIELGLAGKKL